MTTATNVEWMVYADDGSWLGDYSSKSAAIGIAQHLTGVKVERVTTVYMYNDEDDEWEPVNNELVTICSH